MTPPSFRLLGILAAYCWQLCQVTANAECSAQLYQVCLLGLLHLHLKTKQSHNPFSVVAEAGIDTDDCLNGTSANFGDCLLQVDSMSGWCHAVTWSASGAPVVVPCWPFSKPFQTCSQMHFHCAGSQLCFTSHGCSLHVISGLDGNALLRSSPLSEKQKADTTGILQHQLPQQQLVQLCTHHRQLPLKVT